MLDNKYVSAIGSKGILIPLFASNRIRGCTGIEYGMKWEKAYALEALFATPFTIVFPVEISIISIVLGPNITRFGEPM